MGKYSVSIEICSNCKEHAWCTRHNETTYSAIAEELAKQLRGRREDIEVTILKVGGTKMGSFEVRCIHTTLFSKLALGYFPHTVLLGNRVQQFIEDTENGKDTSQYHNLSPVKYHPNTKPYSTNSPNKGSANSNSAISNYGSNVQLQDAKKQTPIHLDLKSQENHNKAKEQPKKQIAVVKSADQKVKVEELKKQAKVDIHKVEEKKEKIQHPKESQQVKQHSKQKEILKKQEHHQKHAENYPKKAEKHEEQKSKHQQNKDKPSKQHHQQNIKVPNHKETIQEGQNKLHVGEKKQESPKQQAQRLQVVNEEKKEPNEQKIQNPPKTEAKVQINPANESNVHPQTEKTPQKEEVVSHKQQNLILHAERVKKEEKHEEQQQKLSPLQPNVQKPIETVVKSHTENEGGPNNIQP